MSPPLPAVLSIPMRHLQNTVVAHVEVVKFDVHGVARLDHGFHDHKVWSDPDFIFPAPTITTTSTKCADPAHRCITGVVPEMCLRHLYLHGLFPGCPCLATARTTVGPGEQFGLEHHQCLDLLLMASCNTSPKSCPELTLHGDHVWWWRPPKYTQIVAWRFKTSTNARRRCGRFVEGVEWVSGEMS